MEKLIELLNEYEKWDVWDYDEEMWRPYYWWGDGCDYEAYLISKKYWFIKWLVENEKVKEIRPIEEEKIYTQEELLLMTLAIQDEPIRFLCDILK